MTNESKVLGAVLMALAVAGCSKAPEPAASSAATATSSESSLSGPPLETRERNAVDYEPAFANQTRAPGIDSAQALDVQVVAEGLELPWAVELLPDGRYLVTERPGRLRIVGADGQISAPVQGVPEVNYKVQGGLLDVALDPGFASNRTIYLTYAEARQGGSGTSLARGVLVEEGGNARLDNVQVIFRQMPTFESDLHYGSRIAFAPDGKLFLALGERALPAAMVQSQDLNSHFGKVVRINSDGSVPADNPFVGRNDAKPEIYSYGHRNIQAAAIDAATGKLWTVEHGPRGGDELNLPQAGANYGWPVISYGINYNGAKITDGITQRQGMEQPVYYWDPVIAPSGLIVYQGDLFPQWKGSIFVGGLGGMKLVRLQMDGDRVAGEEWLLQDRAKRIRDVQQDAAGAIYVLTEDGTNSTLLRLRPAG